MVRWLDVYSRNRGGGGEEAGGGGDDDDVVEGTGIGWGG